MRVLVKRPTVKNTKSDLPHLNSVVLNPLTASSEVRDGLTYTVKKMSLSYLDEFILEIEKFKKPRKWPPDSGADSVHAAIC